jgi:methylenetetrahydrofolate reductase (NADPH)
MKSGSNLEKVLAAGHFAATGELGPPKGADAEVVRMKARILRGNVDAANLTDNQTAIVRLSSIAAGAILVQEGVEPVIQMTCRDRNRLAIQSDLLGASALGIKNLLCIAGDHQRFGNHPGSKNVHDLDAIQLLQMMKALRDDKVFQCGEEVEEVEPRFFLGAASNPFADPFDFRPIRLAKKVDAGADFIQTQLIYNIPKFKEFMKRVRDMGLHERTYILAGVGPIKSVGMAKYMRDNVAGMDVPDEIVERMREAPKEQRRAEGVKMCAEFVREMKEIEGVAGVHVMAVEWEEAVPEIMEQAGLLPRPEV